MFDHSEFDERLAQFGCVAILSNIEGLRRLVDGPEPVAALAGGGPLGG